MQCASKRCKAPATHAVIVSIPARGHPAVNGKMIDMFMHLGLCLAHAHKVDRIAPEGQQEVTSALNALGRAAPDFSRAQYRPVALDSNEVAIWQAQLAPKQ